MHNLRFVLAAILCFSLFISCQGGEKEAPVEETESIDESTTEEGPAEKFGKKVDQSIKDARKEIWERKKELDKKIDRSTEEIKNEYKRRKEGLTNTLNEQIDKAAEDVKDQYQNAKNKGHELQSDIRERIRKRIEEMNKEDASSQSNTNED